MNIKNICSKEVYKRNDEEKTAWPQVGKLFTADDGKQFITLNLFPNQKFYVFEQRDKDAAPGKPQAAPQHKGGAPAEDEIPF